MLFIDFRKAFSVSARRVVLQAAQNQKRRTFVQLDQRRLLQLSI